ncbi:glycosyltransferase family 4 protein [Chryseobacterium balustinum]|uniref:Glycosyl transferase n=1 Tax=Chryseobacterium balustinum TaxID=246 RepID=A0AAX2IU53_9FLAO|nr:glycosyltransferase family 4 protein [Chryseobacterium balustinum]AZB28245.1 glycosyltransferase WbuB [Chryseobacterium balustinum]SKB90247.1 Glycosyltransferase involved in cell wall bisynthesis [Chryseobacterium balustinum]SQA92323.1 putative glycosyl transferase [Chryseobacterium balustinum]
MKLIYLHQYFTFPDSNGGTRSYDLAKSFISENIEVTVITSTSEIKYKTDKRWTVIEREGITVNYIYLPYGNHLSYFQRLLVFVKFLFFSSFRLLKLKGDILLATSTPLTIGIPALMKKWINKTPFIFEVRDVWPEAVIAIGAVKNKWMQKLLYMLEKTIYKNASAIVPLSVGMQHSIVTRYPQFKNKTDIIIENISEISRFQNKSDVVNLKEVIGFVPRFSVLYAGTFGKVNGLIKFIELAEETLKLDEKLVYILIGSGAEKENIINSAKERDLLNRNVFILNPITKNELPLWYNAVSMGSSFVIDIPELWVNSANKFFDTLGANKPILINHEGWQAETIRERNIGYVLPLEINEKSANDFVKYTKDQSLIDEQGEMALKLAKEKYSLEKATENYLKVIKKMKNV